MKALTSWVGFFVVAVGGAGIDASQPVKLVGMQHAPQGAHTTSSAPAPQRPQATPQSFSTPSPGAPQASARPAPRVVSGHRQPDRGIGARRRPAAGTAAPPVNTPVLKNSRLAVKLQAYFPPGTNIQRAAAGFENQGQFVAAVHVSRNLGIPFRALKSKMLDSKMSLGQAIQTLRPYADTPRELARAETQANADFSSSDMPANRPAAKVKPPKKRTGA